MVTGSGKVMVSLVEEYDYFLKCHGNSQVGSLYQLLSFCYNINIMK